MSRLALIALTLSLAGGSALGARARFPEWKGAGVYITGTNETAPRLENDLAEFQSKVGAQYTIVIVGTAARSGQWGAGYGDAAMEFGDDLYSDWVKKGALENGLDPQKHVLITHSLHNRSVGIHWGSDWDALGFHGEAGSQVIDRSDFVAHARNEHWRRANMSLVERIDAELAEKVAARDQAERERKARLQQAQALMPGQLAALRQELDGIEAKDGDVVEAKKQAAALSDQAAAALAKGDVDAAEATARQARDRTQAASRLAAAHARRRYFIGHTLPRILALLLLVALAVVAAMLALSRRRWRRLFDTVAGTWKERLGPATVRLLELEEKHAIFFKEVVDLQRRLEGDSARRYREAGEAVDGLFLCFDAAGVRLDQARRHAGSWRPTAAPYQRALDMLESGELTLSTESKLDKRKLFVPEPRKEAVAVARLFEEIDLRYGKAVELLEALHGDWRAAPEAVQSLARALDGVEEAIKTLGDRGVSTTPHVQERARLHAEARAAADLLPRDFLLARKRADEATAAARALRDKLEGIAEAARALTQDIVPGAAALEGRVAELRKEIRVKEAIFDPDHWIAEVRALSVAARQGLESGDLEAARGNVDEAVARLAGARERVEGTVAAREENPKRLIDAKKRLADLRGRTEVGRRTLSELGARYAPSSFAVEADNLKECTALYHDIDRLIALAEHDSSPTAQRYLAAADELGRADRGLDAVALLLDEIQKKREAIEAAEARAREKTGRAQAAQVELSAYVKEHDFAVREGAIAATEAAGPALGELAETMDAPKPDWFELEGRIDGLATALADAEIAARRDVELCALAKREVGDAAQVLTRVRAELEASTEDRRPANARLGAAAEELERARAAVEIAHQDWELVLAAARAAVALAGTAAEMAARDFEAAHAARTALAAAAQRIGAASRYYGEGVSATLTTPQGHLESGQAALARQEYEQALGEAERAGAAADAAARAALREADRRREAREEAERERRRAAERARRSSWSASSSSSFGAFSRSSSSSSSGRSWSSSSSSSGRSYGGSRSSGRGY